MVILSDSTLLGDECERLAGVLALHHHKSENQSSSKRLYILRSVSVFTLYFANLCATSTGTACENI